MTTYMLSGLCTLICFAVLFHDIDLKGGRRFSNVASSIDDLCEFSYEKLGGENLTKYWNLTEN